MGWTSLNSMSKKEFRHWKKTLQNLTWWNEYPSNKEKICLINKETQSQLKAIGNGQVSLCFAVVWRLLEMGGAIKEEKFMKSTRSKIMASIKSENTGSENALCTALEKAGIKEFVKNDKTLPGSPDIAFHDKKIAVFVDGCFWHGCPKHYKEPKTNVMYWHKKIKNNKQRDSRANKELKALGWKSVRIWEHEIKEINKALRKIIRAMKGKAK